MNEELKITSEDIRLLKEMKDNCLKASVYDDEKRLLKANAITKFLVEHEERQELIDYLKEEINEAKESWGNCVYYNNEKGMFEVQIEIRLLEEILSKIERNDK